MFDKDGDDSDEHPRPQQRENYVILSRMQSRRNTSRLLRKLALGHTTVYTTKPMPTPTPMAVQIFKIWTTKSSGENAAEELRCD